MKDSVKRISECDTSELLYSLNKKCTEMKDDKTVECSIVANTVINRMEEKARKPRYLVSLSITRDSDIISKQFKYERIDVKTGVGNDEKLTAWELNRYYALQELIIGDDCLHFVQGIEMDSMEHLRNITIGNSCFSEATGAFVLRDCGKLKSVTIGNNSCVMWSDLVMKNCGVEKIEISDGCFVDCQKIVLEELNQLKEIQIGSGSMNGSSCALTMNGSSLSIVLSCRVGAAEKAVCWKQFVYPSEGGGAESHSQSRKCE